MLERIKNRFKNPKDSIFDTDKNGRTIYYPFHKPGNAFYIDENQRKKTEKYYILFWVTFAATLISLQILRSNDLLPVHYVLTFNTMIFGPVLILYYLRVKRFANTLEPYLYKQTKIPRLFYMLLLLTFIQILNVAACLYVFYLAPVFIGMLLVWHFTFLIILTIAAHRTIKPVWIARKERARGR